LIPASVHPIVEVLSTARPEIAFRPFGCGSRGAIHKFSPQSCPIRDRCGEALLSVRCHRMPTDRSRARHESPKPSGYGNSLLIMLAPDRRRRNAPGPLDIRQRGGPWSVTSRPPAEVSRCTARGKVKLALHSGGWRAWQPSLRLGTSVTGPVADFARERLPETDVCAGHRPCGDPGVG